MKHFRDRVICNFIYGGFTKQEYQELREEVREKDRSSLCTTSLCLLLMFGGLFLGSVIHLSIIRTKLREMMQRRYIEKQRDTDKLTGCLTKAAFEHKMKNRMKSEDEE